MFRTLLFSEIHTNRFVLTKLIIAVFLCVFTVGITIHVIEPEIYPSVFDGIWWAIVTISTVGYGDFVPESILGRILGILLIGTGIALFSVFLTNLSTSTVIAREQRQKGRGFHKKTGHFLVIGWNERSRILIEKTHKLYPNKDIVLIDETLEKIPSQFDYIRFIKGSPIEDEALLRANLMEADTVVITANLHIAERMADANTILTLLTIKGLHPSIYAIAEIVTHEQVKNAKRASANEVIETSHHISLLLMNGTLFHGLSDVIEQMLSHDQKDHITINPLPDALVGKTVGDAIQREDHSGKFLLGLRRRQSTILHPSKELSLESDDELIFVRR